MQRLTQELRQFESIFRVDHPGQNRVTARIFTVEEELAFAGHPLLGTAAVLHHLTGSQAEMTWPVALKSGVVQIETQRRAHGFWVEMDQGVASYRQIATPEIAAAILEGFGLGPGALAERLPIATVTTDLPYVIVPVTADALATARVRCTDLEQRLARLSGKFAYLLDPEACEGRSWDNLGRVEDIATGSAAGPAAAYLWCHGRTPDSLIVRQGRFAGRPSEIGVRRDPVTNAVMVSGVVVILAEGSCL